MVSEEKKKKKVFIPRFPLGAVWSPGATQASWFRFPYRSFFLSFVYSKRQRVNPTPPSIFPGRRQRIGRPCHASAVLQCPLVSGGRRGDWKSWPESRSRRLRCDVCSILEWCLRVVLCLPLPRYYRILSSPHSCTYMASGLVYPTCWFSEAKPCSSLSGPWNRRTLHKASRFDIFWKKKIIKRKTNCRLKRFAPISFSFSY